MDIDNIDSVVKFRDFLKSTHGGLDVLVNNAATAYKMGAIEPFSEQAEVTCRVNFFATMNCCNELFPLLRPHARVVNVSSSSGKSCYQLFTVRILIKEIITLYLGFLKKICGKEPESSKLQKQFADPQLTINKLVSLVNDFVQ